jgi:hypothetical protein
VEESGKGSMSKLSPRGMACGAYHCLRLLLVAANMLAIRRKQVYGGENLSAV